MVLVDVEGLKFMEDSSNGMLWFLVQDIEKKVTLPANVGGLSMTCPVCREAMVSADKPDTVLFLCPRCGQTWFPGKGLDDYLSKLPRSYAPEDLHRLRKANGHRKEHSFEKNISYFPCLECGEQMHRKMFGCASYILTHQCVSHGRLLSKEDLRCLEDYYSRGGEVIELEEEKETAEEKIRELEGMLRTTRAKGRMGPGGAGVSPTIPT